MAKSLQAFLEKEDRLFLICEMAKTNLICSSDIINTDPKAFSRSNVSLYFAWLVENGYLRTQRGVNPQNYKSMNYYSATGKQYKKRPAEDYYLYGIGHKKVPAVPIPHTFKPHPKGRIIKLLDNPLPRPENDGYGRKIEFGIGSSFNFI